MKTDDNLSYEQLKSSTSSKKKKKELVELAKADQQFATLTLGSIRVWLFSLQLLQARQDKRLL